MVHQHNQKNEDIAIQKIEMIKKRYIDVYERTFKFNTIISGVMECYNAITKQSNTIIWKEAYHEMIKCIDPICPHVAEEMRCIINEIENK